MTASIIADFTIIVVFPIPCNIFDNICSIVIKIIEIELILKSDAPSEAFGNRIFNI